MGTGGIFTVTGALLEAEEGWGVGGSPSPFFRPANKTCRLPVSRSDVSVALLVALYGAGCTLSEFCSSQVLALHRSFLCHLLPAPFGSLVGLWGRRGLRCAGINCILFIGCLILTCEVVYMRKLRVMRLSPPPQAQSQAPVPFSTSPFQGD